jgi:hypothetical protein
MYYKFGSVFKLQTAEFCGEYLKLFQQFATFFFLCMYEVLRIAAILIKWFYIFCSLQAIPYPGAFSENSLSAANLEDCTLAQRILSRFHDPNGAI